MFGALALSYVLLIALEKQHATLSSRLWYIVERTFYHNATARPPMLLVIVVVGWAAVVGSCRQAGIKLELVIGPEPTLPARAILRAALVLLNCVLFAHLTHFVIETMRHPAEHRPWYLLTDVVLQLGLVALFLWPPTIGEVFVDHVASPRSGERERDRGGECEECDSEVAAPGAPLLAARYEGVDSKRHARVLVAGCEDTLEGHSILDDSAGCLYPGTRSGLARAVLESLSAPFAPVTFWHVIVADYGTSLAKCLGDLQLTGCVAWRAHVLYVELPAGDAASAEAIWAEWRPRCGASAGNAWALALPFWVRLAQCCKQCWSCEQRGDRCKHALNALKYCTAFPLVYAGWLQKRAGYATRHDEQYQRSVHRLLVSAALLNSCCSFAWDVLVDWGLLAALRRGPKSTTAASPAHGGVFTADLVLARVEKPRARKAAYALLLAFNLSLRFAWALSVFGHVQTRGAGLFFLETAEVLRRTVWAIFRIESEYIQRGLPLANTQAKVKR